MCPNSIRTDTPHCFSGNVGTYLCTGASRSSRPRSHSCNAATAVIGFASDPVRNTVAGFTATSFSKSAFPNAPTHRVVPRDANAAVSPTTPCRTRSASTAASTRRSFSAENSAVRGCANAANALKRTKIPDNRIPTFYREHPPLR